MPDAKIEIKVGAISFSGEGTSDWLSEQLDKVLNKIPELSALGEPDVEPKDGEPQTHKVHKVAAAGKDIGTLAAFLKGKKATSDQTRKFLATALWLQESQQLKRLKTGDVTKALSAHNQGKLKNPSQCLISNASAGRIVREGKVFYVADDGRAELDK